MFSLNVGTKLKMFNINSSYFYLVQRHTLTYVGNFNFHKNVYVFPFINSIQHFSCNNTGFCFNMVAVIMLYIIKELQINSQ